MSFSCLVLGGSGFLGSHLCEALLRAGHRVKVLVPEGFSLHNLAGIIEQLEILRFDLNEAGVNDEIWGGVDCVFHLACTTRPKTSNNDPARDLEENLISTIRILDRCVTNNVRRIIFASSGGTVYGKTDSSLISEDHLLAPLCSYGIHKLAIEHYLRIYHILHNLDYRVARIANAYGEKQAIYGNQGLIGTVLDRVISGRAIDVYGKGTAVRDYIYVTDVVSALLQLAEKNTPSRIFNVGSGHGASVMEIIHMAETALNLKAKINFLPERSVDVEKNVLDITQIHQETGWKPQIMIAEGIARSAAWWHKEVASTASR